VQSDGPGSPLQCSVALSRIEALRAGIEHARTLLDLDPKKGRYYDLVGRLNDCLGKKNERVGGLVFSRALQSGGCGAGTQDGAGEARNLRCDEEVREEGKPDEVRAPSRTPRRRVHVLVLLESRQGHRLPEREFKYEQTFKPVQEGAATGQK